MGGNVESGKAAKLRKKLRTAPALDAAVLAHVAAIVAGAGDRVGWGVLLDHHPAVVAGAAQGGEAGRQVDDAAAELGEDAQPHGLDEVGGAAQELLHEAALDVLEVDVPDAGAVVVEDGDGIGAAVNQVAGVDAQADQGGV